MNKISFKNSRGLNLVGILYLSNSKSVIIMCHGFTGDKSEWGRFDKIAESLNKENYNILRFDFSGSGESDDDSLTVDKQVDDINCAIDYVKNKGLTKIGLLGLSLGGLVALKCFNKEIKTMVLLAPVTDKVKYTWDKRYSQEQLRELKDKGYITYLRDKGIRNKLIIDKQILKDRETINQKELLSKVKCPVLIIHGDQDKVVPLEDSKNAIKLLSSDSKLEIINGSGHEFSDLDRVIEYTKNWFKKLF